MHDSLTPIKQLRAYRRVGAGFVLGSTLAILQLVGHWVGEKDPWQSFFLWLLFAIFGLLIFAAAHTALRRRSTAGRLNGGVAADPKSPSDDLGSSEPNAGRQDEIVLAAYRVALTATVAIAIATVVICCFAVVSTLRSECAGGTWLLGYRPFDYVGPVLACAFIIFMFVNAKRKGIVENWNNIIENSDPLNRLTVFQFRSTRITQNMLILFAVFFGMVTTAALCLGIAITHHQAVLTNCYVLLVPS